jgi:hypothetical protein
MKLFRSGLATLIVGAGITTGASSQAHADTARPSSSPPQTSSDGDDLAARQSDMLALVQLLLVAIVTLDQSGTAAHSDPKR